jgi:hypothetical protein
MSFTSALFRAARLSADGRAISKGPAAIGRRIVRKTVYRHVNLQLGRTLARLMGAR